MKQNLSERVEIRLGKAEKKRYTEKAREIGLTLSAYLRMKIMRHPLRLEERGKEEK